MTMRTQRRTSDDRPSLPRRLVASLAGAIVVAAGCGDAATDEGPIVDAGSGAPVVIATTSVWADVVANLTCDGLATVQTVIPIGADAHAFEPSLADRGALESADLIVVNGLGLEEGLDDTIAAVEDGGTPVFRVTDHLALLPGDPHVWFDPTRVAAVLDPLAASLVDDAGLEPARIAPCVEAFRAEVNDLDREIAAMVAAVPTVDRRLVTNHESLTYLADRYGLEIVGTVLPASSTMTEASPARLQALTEQITATGVRAIVVEAQANTDDADTLASRVGDVEVVAIHTESLGPAGSGAETYVDLVRTAAQLITDALT